MCLCAHVCSNLQCAGSLSVKCAPYQRTARSGLTNMFEQLWVAWVVPQGEPALNVIKKLEIEMVKYNTLCVCAHMCVEVLVSVFNLANVMSAIGLYKVIVLCPGGGVIGSWQLCQILNELRTERGAVWHTVTRHKQSKSQIILTN